MFAVSVRTKLGRAEGPIGIGGYEECARRRAGEKEQVTVKEEEEEEEEAAVAEETRGDQVRQQKIACEGEVSFRMMKRVLRTTRICALLVQMSSSPLGPSMSNVIVIQLDDVVSPQLEHGGKSTFLLDQACEKESRRWGRRGKNKRQEQQPRRQKLSCLDGERLVKHDKRLGEVERAVDVRLQVPETFVHLLAHKSAERIVCTGG
eukprot:757743-Hanusia_phi.AAC.1